MQQEPVPFERLESFLEKLGLTQQALAVLEPHREVFTSRQEAFGQFFLDYFLGIPRTRLILEQNHAAQRHKKALSHWFGALFSQDLDRRFLTYLWNSGVRHVQLSLDQRFVNLGYAVTRQFCQRLIQEQVPAPEREALTALVDRMLDFCVLAATDSFISMTSRCDREMIQGIAHQVRNPVTVIGGNIMRLLKKIPPDNPNRQAYETVLAENQRLERMVADIALYTEMFQGEPRPQPCSLVQALDRAVQHLREAGRLEGVRLRLELDPALPPVNLDPKDLEIIFAQLLENAAEAADKADPRVEVRSRPGRAPGFVEVEIFNTGPAPGPEQVQELLSPFSSSKPMGTGMGLPIAGLAARRGLGSLSLEAAPGGVRCLLNLPLAGGEAAGPA
ncbi:MAG: histidine kinase [Desulfarculus sp.]|nr:MAG: histidine kinase [Desulfarculus sp.]